MTPAPRLVLVHGWGFDAGCWDRLRAALDGLGAETVDLGFFGRPRRPRLERGRPLVAVGHSLGFLWLLRRRPFPWRGLVAIAGMPRFTRGDDYDVGVAPQVLGRMRARFAQAPAATLKDFRVRCGRAEDNGEDGVSPQGPMDVARLADGLRWLAEWDQRPVLDAEAAPVLALAAGDDAILPPALSEAVFAGRPETALHRTDEGGHALPLSRPEWCAAHIRAFVEAL